MTAPRDNALLHLIKSLIAEDGSISLAAFMELALSHPEHGYYMTGDHFGLKGDFITAPEISQMFGELIGLWSLDQMQRQSIADQAGFFEMGPGRGTLMADILRAITPFSQTRDWPIHMLEISPTLMDQQQKRLAPHVITHHRDASPWPEIPLIFIANEFFDALPIRQWVHRQGKWFERKVTVLDGDLSLSLEASEDYPFLQNKGGDHSEDQVFEQAPALPLLVARISQHINRFGGAALIIDYGKTNPFGDTLQAVRDHKPVDVLDTPGAADLSAWVDFAAIKAQAEHHGLQATGPIGQGAFLKQLGLYHRAEQLSLEADPKTRRMIAAAVDRLTSPAQMGTLFQVMALLPQGIDAEPPGFAETTEHVS